MISDQENNDILQLIIPFNIAYVLFLGRETKFHTHTKRQIKLQSYSPTDYFDPRGLGKRCDVKQMVGSVLQT